MADARLQCPMQRGRLSGDELAVEQHSRYCQSSAPAAMRDVNAVATAAHRANNVEASTLGLATQPR